MTEIIEQAVRDILTACTPRKVILYAQTSTQRRKQHALALALIVQ